jgi:hypothetical protein
MSLRVSMILMFLMVVYHAVDLARALAHHAG